MALADESTDGQNDGHEPDTSRVLVWLLAVALVFGLPFALKYGAEFFLPITAAVVIAIALVPTLEWLERRGVPSSVAAGACVLAFLALVNGALALIIVPASDWFARLPDNLPRIRENIAPLIRLYSNIQTFVDDSLQSLATGAAARAQAVAVETPNSLMGYLSSAAPAAAFQTLFAVLLMFFLLSGWSNLRRTMIRSRASFEGARHTSAIIQNVVDATSAYLMTIATINVALGLVSAVFLWALGMPSPLMWGGIVALCNFLPYVGPIGAAALLAMGGLMTFDSIALAMMPAVIHTGLHLVEANIVTPTILGRRLTINPMLILVSLSFWGWIWGAPGAFLAVPILIIGQTVWHSVQGAAVPKPPLTVPTAVAEGQPSQQKSPAG